MNDMLVAEFKRLGSRAPIDEVLKTFGAVSITDLKPEQYDAVIAAVKAK